MVTIKGTIKLSQTTYVFNQPSLTHSTDQSSKENGKMKSSLVLLGFLLSLALFAQRTECFTAGIGNLGIEGKRNLALKYKLYGSMEEICRNTYQKCQDAGIRISKKKRTLEHIEDERVEN